MTIAAGRESTCLFESYHPGSVEQRAFQKLKTSPNIRYLGPLLDDNGKPVQLPTDDKFWRTLIGRVEEHLKAKGVNWYWNEFLSFAEVIVSAIIYMIATYYTTWHGSMIAAIVLGVITGRLGFLMHNGNHRSTSKSTWRNHFTGCMMDMIGSSHLIWSHEHQVAHHCDPNELGRDNDCSIGSPYLKLHPDIQETVPLTVRWQHILTPIAISVGIFKWYIGDFTVFLTGRVGSVKFHITTKDWIQFLLFKGQWLFFHVLLPIYFHGFFNLRQTWLPFITFMVLAAHYLENIFIVNHIQDGCAYPPRAHWAVKQVWSTTNWGTGSRFWNFVSGGLNHQLEHHLFPSLHIYLYPEVAPIVKKTCEEFGLPYRNFPTFWHAWFSCMSYLKKLGRMGMERPKAY